MTVFTLMAIAYAICELFNTTPVAVEFLAFFVTQQLSIIGLQLCTIIMLHSQTPTPEEEEPTFQKTNQSTTSRSAKLASTTGRDSMDVDL